MSAPERAENPTSAGGLDPVLELLMHLRSQALGVFGDYWCEHCKEPMPDVLKTRIDLSKAMEAHFRAALDAHVTERCAQTLEEAASRLPGFDGIRTHGDAAHWLRDRAAAVRGER